jgi:uncharacterized protein (TIGR01319 family)
MAVSQVEAKSLLAIDIGSTRTRALLFDAVEGRYRFLGEGAAATTMEAPIHDVSEGVRLALDQLQAITGRLLVDADERLIIPSTADGSGIDAFVATFSAGPPLKVFAVGLLEDVSLRTARRLASSTYAHVAGSFSLNDRRKIEEQIDLIMRARPDVVLILGGTDNGASDSVLKLIEPVGLACYLLPQAEKPEIVYAGNQELAEQVKGTLERLATLHVAPNARPSLDYEQPGPARARLVQVARNIYGRKIHGMNELVSWASEQVLPSASGFGRVVRFLSQVYDPAKGVLGVDLGASTTTVAAAFGGDLQLRVFPGRGMGAALAGSAGQISMQAVARWLPFEASPEDVANYLYNKSLSPASLPITQEELAMEQALAREVLRSALREIQPEFPARAACPRPDLMPWFEPVVAGGGVLTQAPTRGQTLLMLLDAIQPTGVTTVVLDQNNLAPSIGAAASVNPILAIQVLESGTFLNLGTVISPVSEIRLGTPVLRVRLVYEAGSEMKLDIKQGTFETLPLPVGQAARLHLQPLHRADIGMGGPGRGGSLRVVGGALGVVIDARGRPLQLPADGERRRELIRKWLWTLGG